MCWAPRIQGGGQLGCPNQVSVQRYCVRACIHTHTHTLPVLENAFPTEA